MPEMLYDILLYVVRQHISVSKVTGQDEFDSLQGRDFPLCHLIPTSFGAHQASSPIGAVCPFP